MAPGHIDELQKAEKCPIRWLLWTGFIVLSKYVLNIPVFGGYLPSIHVGTNVYIRKNHDGVIKWKHFPRYYTFVQEIHRSPVNSPKGQWRGAMMLSLICAWIKGRVNNSDAGDSRRHRGHYGVIVMIHIWWTYRVDVYQAEGIVVQCSHYWSTK